MSSSTSVDERSVTESTSKTAATPAASCRVAVIWIDWYAYHVARFQGLLRHPGLGGQVAGIEMVGGIGVHAGLKFREEIPSSLPVETLLPKSSWGEADKWSLARLLWRRLNKLNPKVILVPGYYTIPALAAAVWAKLHSRQAVLMTESTAHDHARVWWRETFKKLLVRTLFDWAVAGGEAHRRYLRQMGFSPRRTLGFYDVVDNSFFHDCCSEIRSAKKAAEFGLPSDYFLYVGRLAEEKSTDLLLTAYVQYRVSGGTTSLVLVGDGPQMTRLQQMAADSPYSSEIYFPGLKATSELPNYYAFASAFVLASSREPWGLVVNEAMAASLPVIVSNRCGCVEDLVHESVNGFRFDPAKTENLVHCLLRFSALGTRARQEMGYRSREIISRFTPDAWANEIAQIPEP